MKGFMVLLTLLTATQVAFAYDHGCKLNGRDVYANKLDAKRGEIIYVGGGFEKLSENNVKYSLKKTSKAEIYTFIGQDTKLVISYPINSLNGSAALTMLTMGNYKPQVQWCKRSK
jgi:hypothetical protein